MGGGSRTRPVIPPVANGGRRYGGAVALRVSKGAVVARFLLATVVISVRSPSSGAGSRQGFSLTRRLANGKRLVALNRADVVCFDRG